MKQIYKDPILYYVLVPVMVALWPLLIWGVYLPRSRQNWDSEKSHYEKAQKIIAEVLTVDPDRVVLGDSLGRPCQ